MKFWHSGFFGYGEVGNFKYWSPAHIIPILLLIAGIVVVYKFRERIRQWKREGRFRFIVAFVLVLVLMSYYWRMFYVGSDWGYDNMLVSLPLDVCFWGTLFCAFTLTSMNDRLFGLNFFLSLSLGILPITMPTVISKAGPAYYKYYQFWIEHSVPVLMTLYMMFVHGKRPKYKDLWISYGFLALLSVPAICINRVVPEANFLFLAGQNDEMGGNVTSIFPRSQGVRLVLFSAVILAIFHVTWLIMKVITRSRRPASAGEGGA